ncbi:SMP-30/gluconolactonase/LRE family protein [Roseibium algae]|uniref:SMP-30/gluconolactonase/LRE family protein n=1 Tax=Roseibium algae TaxID=3123038 RepID=A0ABU8TFI2_9HYPH
MSEVFDTRRCTLGEGPLWHPERQQLFWFDILEKRLHTQINTDQQTWQFDEHVSAAGWIDRDRLLIASNTKLFEFNIATGTCRDICPLEADNSVTRSNDGRADPQGGFWIGTMGMNAEPGAGAIYRYYRGELRKLVPDVTISNAICFAPSGKTAYYADTDLQKIWRLSLDKQGWPMGTPDVFVDLAADKLFPDGAVVDANGNLWNAQWGAHRVACYSPDGQLIDTIEFPAAQISCPAFGGQDMSTLFATSAAIGISGDENGLTYSANTSARGQREHPVIL